MTQLTVSPFKSEEISYKIQTRSPMNTCEHGSHLATIWLKIMYVLGQKDSLLFIELTGSP